MPGITEFKHSQAEVDVIIERRRQIEVEGWTAEHDDQHINFDLAKAGAAIALFAAKTDLQRSAGPLNRPNFWPWSPKWWKPTDRRRDLVKSAALIVAEIERLDRAAAKAAA